MTASIIYSILSTDSAVADLTDGDIFPGVAPQDTDTPYVVYTLISSVPVLNKDKKRSVEELRFQIDAYADSFEEVNGLCEKIRAALEFKSGQIAGYQVMSILFDNENDNFESSPEIFRKQQDYKIKIKF